jgi:hypothetical protein
MRTHTDDNDFTSYATLGYGGQHIWDRSHYDDRLTDLNFGLLVHISFELLLAWLGV